MWTSVTRSTVAAVRRAAALPRLQACAFLIAASAIFRPVLSAASEERPPEAPPAVEWTRAYSQEDRTDVNPCLIRAEDGGAYVVGISSRRIRQGRFDYSLWIWRVDEGGDRVWARVPKIPALDGGEDIVWSRCLCLEDERVILAQESLPRTGIWFLRFDSSGEVSRSRELGLGRMPHVLRSVRRVRDGILVCGQQLDDRRDAWVMKLDEEGKAVWQKTYDRGRAEDAFSLAVGSDGGFVFAADSGEYNKFGGGPSEIWVVKCDADGKVLDEATFSGRHPTIARSGDGTLALSMNTSDFPHVRQEVLGLDAELTRTWGPRVLYEGSGLGLFPVAVDGRGDFVLAGAKGGEPWIWKLDREGRLTQEGRLQARFSSVRIDAMLVGEDGALLAASGRDPAPVEKAPEADAGADEHRDLLDIVVTKVRP